MKYRADIDGLRSIAVIPVILFHMGFNWIAGGYFGVDVFFVISGFLITSILYQEIVTDSFSMKKFWLRRVRRILPALITVVSATLLVAPFFIFKADILSITSDALPALFSYANFHLWLNFGDYWGASAENSYFLHAWSLSVEEQFYVFYPILLFLLYKSRQSLSKWLIAIIIFSLGAFLFGSKFHPLSTFYLLPTRAWELASGGILAVMITDRRDININPILKSYLAILGFLFVLSSYFVFTGNKGVNFFAIFPVLGSVMIIAFSTGDNIIGKLLSSKPLVYIGKISYSLYLWHWPIIVLFKTNYLSKFSIWQFRIIAIVLMVVFSILSYNLVENKTRKWKHTPKLVLCSMLIVVGFIFLLKSPVINKVYNSTFNKTIFYGFYYDINPNIKPLETSDARRVGIIAPNRDDKYKESYKNGGIITSHIEGNPQIVVMGDSHGAMWAKVIDEIADKEHMKATFYTANGVSPFINSSENDNPTSKYFFSKLQRISYANDFIQNLKRWKPKLIVIARRWNIISDEEIKDMENLVLLTQELSIKILILNQPPQIKTMGDRNSAQFLTFLGYKSNRGDQYIKHGSEVEVTNLKLQNHFAKYANITFFDVHSHFIQKNNPSNSLIIKDSDILYFDDDHLSYQGTLLMKNELDKIIIGLVTKDK